MFTIFRHKIESIRKTLALTHKIHFRARIQASTLCTHFSVQPNYLPLWCVCCVFASHSLLHTHSLTSTRTRLSIWARSTTTKYVHIRIILKVHISRISLLFSNLFAAAIIQYIVCTICRFAVKNRNTKLCCRRAISLPFRYVMMFVRSSRCLSKEKCAFVLVKVNTLLWRVVACYDCVRMWLRDCIQYR